MEDVLCIDYEGTDDAYMRVGGVLVVLERLLFVTLTFEREGHIHTFQFHEEDGDIKEVKLHHSSFAVALHCKRLKGLVNLKHSPFLDRKWVWRKSNQSLLGPLTRTSK